MMLQFNGSDGSLILQAPCLGSTSTGRCCVTAAPYSQPWENVGWHTAKTVEMCMLHESKTQIWELEICWVKKTRSVLVKKKTVGDQHDKDLYKFLYYKDEKGIQERDLGSS